eukprot:357218-Chlamydomonas_euryale.AAC.9
MAGNYTVQYAQLASRRCSVQRKASAPTARLAKWRCSNTEGQRQEVHGVDPRRVCLCRAYSRGPPYNGRSTHLSLSWPSGPEGVIPFIFYLRLSGEGKERDRQHRMDGNNDDQDKELAD